MARFLHFSMALYKLKQQGMTHKMIERKTGISVSTQKRRFNKIV